MFRSSNQFDGLVEKATSNHLTSEDWNLMSEVCQSVRDEKSARDCIAALVRRLSSRKSNVLLYSLTLANTLVQTCGLVARREIASRNFMAALTKIVNDKSAHIQVRTRVLTMLNDWKTEFSSDPSLSMVEETYNALKNVYPIAVEPRPSQRNFSQEEEQKRKEEEELQLALAISLSEQSCQPKRISQRRPSLEEREEEVQKMPVSSGPCKVRALYDFPGKDAGELGFLFGDVIVVIEKSYKDWWTGEHHGRRGIFPVNYVEEITASTSHENLIEEANILNLAGEIDDFLNTLTRIDPIRDNITENGRLQETYNKLQKIRPQVLKDIEETDKRRGMLADQTEKLNASRNSYLKLQEAAIARYSVPVSVHPPHMIYSGQPSYQQPPQNYMTQGPYSQATAAPGSQPQAVYYQPPPPGVNEQHMHENYSQPPKQYAGGAPPPQGYGQYPMPSQAQGAHQDWYPPPQAPSNYPQQMYPSPPHPSGYRQG